MALGREQIEALVEALPEEVVQRGARAMAELVRRMATYPAEGRAEEHQEAEAMAEPQMNADGRR